MSITQLTPGLEAESVSAWQSYRQIGFHELQAGDIPLLDALGSDSAIEYMTDFSRHRFLGWLSFERGLIEERCHNPAAADYFEQSSKYWHQALDSVSEGDLFRRLSIDHDIALTDFRADIIYARLDGKGLDHQQTRDHLGELALSACQRLIDSTIPIELPAAAAIEPDVKNGRLKGVMSELLVSTVVINCPGLVPRPSSPRLEMPRQIRMPGVKKKSSDLIVSRYVENWQLESEQATQVKWTKHKAKAKDYDPDAVRVIYVDSTLNVHTPDDAKRLVDTILASPKSKYQRGYLRLIRSNVLKALQL